MLMTAPHLAPTDGWIGRAIRRREDDALVRGRGTFVDDLSPDDCLYIEFVRSPVAAGRLDSLSLDEAASVPGVVVILTGADLQDLPAPAVNRLIAEVRIPDTRYLAEGEVVCVGQPVAAVIAETPTAARDGAALVKMTVEELGQRVDHAPVFAQEWSGGDVERAFADADCVVTARVTHARVSPACLEPRAAVAAAGGAGTLTAWLPTQTPHRARSELARILALDPAGVRIVAPDVGGAFGGKASIGLEDVVVAFAALRLRRPVKWCASRSEDFLFASQGRGGSGEGELALRRDGTFLGMRARFGFPLGSWLPFSAVVPARNAGRILPGPYRVEAVAIRSEGWATATAPLNIYRGAGRPEAALLMERLADEAAHAVGLDPIEIRRRNIVGSQLFPYRTATGEVLDSGDYEALIDKASQLAAYRDLLQQRDRRREAGEIVGIGTALYVEPCGQGWESARIGLAPDGGIVAATGSTAQGQGRLTASAQIVADVLAVPLADVLVTCGDTASSPEGIGALASRSTPIGGSSLLKAAHAFREAAIARAAERLGRRPEDLETHGSGVRSRSGDDEIGWVTLAALPDPPAASLAFHAAGEAWSSGCCIAAVAIDRETGTPAVESLIWVDDAGTVVNPMLVEGQLRGGLAQGLGEALMERVVYDPEGQLVTGSFMDYAMPRADDIPSVLLDSLETPSPMNPLGAKGVGEAGCIGIPAALVAAVTDALRPHGAAPLDMPLTAEKIWHALRDARRGRDR